MASGYIAGQEINGQKAYLFWSYTQDVATRKTTITFTFKVKRTATGWTTWKDNCNAYIEAPDGTDIYNQSTYDYDITSIGVGSYLTICSASKTFTHNSQGVLADVTCDSGIDLTGTSVGEYLNASGSIEVAPIPVGSYIQDLWGTVYIGSAMPMAIDDNGINHTYTHTITYQFGSATGTIVTGLHYNEGMDWNIPLSLAEQIPNSKTGTVTLTCKTYDGATLIGTTTITQTLTVPSTMKPTIDDFWASVNDLVASAWGVYVKGKSAVLMQWIGVGGVYGSTMKTYAITATGHSYTGNILYGSQIVYSNVLTNVGNITFTLVVTDSRGMTNSKSFTINVLDYASPVISAFSAFRGTGGAADELGTQIITHQVYTFSSCGGHNALSVQRINIKQLPSGSYGSNIVVATGVDMVNSGPYSGDNSYQVLLTITDAYGTVTATATVSPTFSLIDFYGATGKGLAIGKLATLDNTFEVDLDTVFNKSVKISGALNTNDANLTSSTVVGTDTLLVNDVDDAEIANTLKKITLDSLFAFFKTRTNYLSTEIVNSDVTSVIDDYLTLDADWTIGTLKIYRFGPMVSLYINATRNPASGVGNIGNDTVATIKDASLRPAVLTTIGTAATGDMASGYIDTAGVIGLSATRAAITAWSFGVTYLI